MAYRGIDAGARKVHPPATDLTRWSLEVDRGRQVWKYLPKGAPRSSFQNPVASKYLAGLPLTREDVGDVPPPKNGFDALSNAISFFGKVQTSDGHWAGDYGGPMFLIPGLAITTYITKTPLPEPVQLELVRYLFNVQNEDGGWGIHIESVSTVFGTCLNYAAMRLLGVPRDDPRMVKAREWLRPHGGCLSVPSWGKFWLAVLNVYQWEGFHSLFPEMCLLPEWIPLHTSRIWCYCRTVYIPMSYIYGVKFQAPVTPLIEELREELIFEPYHQVNWKAARDRIAQVDLYTPHTLVLQMFFKAVDFYEYFAPTWLRRRALDWILKLIEKEDEFTNFIDIGPVNKVINMLICWITKGPTSQEFLNHAERLPDYIWLGTDGMKMNGTNGSQLWDASFMIQGLIETRLRDKFKDVFAKAHEFIDVAQIRVNHPDHKKYYRDETKGGWPFSTAAMGWIVADCTGEGLKAALICKKNKYTSTPLSDDRLFDAVNILLLMQNTTGGYATCERTRGYKFYEYFNASEVFGEIMIDYDYVECSSSALQGLAVFHRLYPEHRPVEISRAIHRASDFMKSIQLPDGSWEGMWGICFTYGTWFGVEGLIEAGVPPTDPSIVRACKFLVSKQKSDGGWGETFMSCVTRTYTEHPQSQVVNTAWAVLALMRADYPDHSVIKRGMQLLLTRQLANGDWAQESIIGVFNKNCMISYSNFKNIFPIWALSRYLEKYPDSEDLVPSLGSSSSQ